MGTDEETADEDTPRDQSWKHGNFSDPEVLRLALIEIASYGEEAVKTSRRNSMRLDAMGKSCAVLAEQQGAIVRELSGIGRKLGQLDRRAELAQALAEANSTRLAVLTRESGIHDRQIHELDDRVQKIRDRNDRIDAEEAARQARLEADVEHLKKDVGDLEGDVRDTKNRHIVTAEQATGVLLGQVVRAQLESSAEISRETRIEINEGKKHAREERSKLKWWLLGLAAAVALAVVNFFAGRATGSHTPFTVPAPALTAPATSH